MSHRRGARSSFLRAAVSPRMLGMLALLVGAALVCGWLGGWQLDRAQLRGQAAAAQERAAQDAHPPELDELLEPRQTFTGDLIGRSVTVRGHYEPEGQLLVVGRSVDGVDGELVLAPLRVPGGEEPVLPVVRGWVPAGEYTADDPRLAPPPGTVELGGYLQGGEGPGAGTPVDGRTDAISPATLLHAWAGPVYTGYLVLHESAPVDPVVADGTAQPLPRPVDLQGGLNVQNVAYALQWWIFGLFALGLWLRLVRDEARELAADAGEGRDEGLPAAPVDTGAVSVSIPARGGHP